MPGFTTHYLMGIKAYHDLPDCQLKHIIAKHRRLYQIGLQGPDIFFYNIPILRYRDNRNIGSYMHEHHVSKFFETYLEHSMQIKSKHQQYQAIAYLCGFLCHYIGDSICHPYIYGRIEHNAHSPSMEHHGLHAALENDIDALLLKKYKNKKPSQFNQAATIRLNGFEPSFISKLLAKCINKTYYPISPQNNYQITPTMVHRSITAIRYGCRSLSDPTGRKKNFIAFFESIFLKNPIASKKMVTDWVIDPIKSLNLNHETWVNPWAKDMASTASFLDLFHQSLQKCNTVFYLYDSELNKHNVTEKVNFEDMLNELGNYSYHSGLPVG